MKRTLTLAGSLFLVSVGLVYQAGCGGSSSNAIPTSPGGGGGGGGTPSVISIVGQAGANSFSPNPANVPSGQAAAWRNADSTTHHIVADNGAFDTGNITPGATSVSVTVPSGNVTYHCTIHPSMVGSINGPTNNPPPGNPY